MLEVNNIYNMDCIKGLKQIDDSTVDLIVTSPPYNVGVAYDVYKDNLPYEDYLAWCKEWFSECYRVLKDDGRICINHYINIMHCDFDKDGNAIGGTCKFPLFDFKLIMEDIGFNVEKMAIWDDPTVSNFTAWGSWMSASAPNIMTPYEGILIGYKKSWKKLTDGISTIDRETFMEGVSGVWHLGTTTGYTKACFPEKLPRMCIELLSYKNDLVVDPFSGSGTTCYVAKGLDRRYIGFEISRSYHTQSIARLCGAPYKVVKEKVEDTRYKEVDLF